CSVVEVPASLPVVVLSIPNSCAHPAQASQTAERDIRSIVQRARNGVLPATPWQARSQASCCGVMSRFPVVYLPHGGGPWPFVEGLGEPSELAALASYLRSVRDVTRERPRALLVISAHWEA